MVEQKLEDVIDNLRYLPDILEKEFSGMELSPDLSVSDCWNHMVQTLRTPKLAPFWAHCGFTDPKALLNALRSAVLTACIYYGVDYQFDCQCSKENPKYYHFFDVCYMKRLFGHANLSLPATYQESAKHYNTHNNIRYVSKDFRDIDEKIKKGLSNAARIYDPAGFNPLLIQRQREDYASKNNASKNNAPENSAPENTPSKNNASTNNPPKKNPPKEKKRTF